MSCANRSSEPERTSRYSCRLTETLRPHSSAHESRPLCTAQPIDNLCRHPSQPARSSWVGRLWRIRRPAPELQTEPPQCGGEDCARAPWPAGSRSKTRTHSPIQPSSYPSVEPAGPAPTTITSHPAGIECGSAPTPYSPSATSTRNNSPR